MIQIFCLNSHDASSDQKPFQKRCSFSDFTRSGLFLDPKSSNIENINSGLGDDIVDLTSPDYSLVGQDITVDGGSGNDTLWGSDANETLKGGVGDDELFGGAGTNVLTGGAGADEFQFTKTSTNDTVKDFSKWDGDTLKFFNTGGGGQREQEPTLRTFLGN